jgi:hypothetical protein
MNPQGKAGAIPPVPVNCPADWFENVIREYGVTAACEWFGHRPDSEFTTETIEILAARSSPAEIGKAKP